MMGAKDYGGDL